MVARAAKTAAVVAIANVVNSVPVDAAVLAAVNVCQKLAQNPSPVLAVVEKLLHKVVAAVVHAVIVVLLAIQNLALRQ